MQLKNNVHDPAERTQTMFSPSAGKGAALQNRGAASRTKPSASWCVNMCATGVHHFTTFFSLWFAVLVCLSCFKEGRRAAQSLTNIEHFCLRRPSFDTEPLLLGPSEPSFRTHTPQSVTMSPSRPKALPPSTTAGVGTAGLKRKCDTRTNSPSELFEVFFQELRRAEFLQRTRK